MIKDKELRKEMKQKIHRAKFWFNARLAFISIIFAIAIILNVICIVVMSDPYRKIMHGLLTMMIIFMLYGIISTREISLDTKIWLIQDEYFKKDLFKEIDTEDKES